MTPSPTNDLFCSFGPQTRRPLRGAVALAAALLASSCVTPQAREGQRSHADFLVLDTHLDTPLHFDRAGWDLGARHDLRTDMAQVDLPRMEDGALDGGFFAIYTDQGPLTPQGYADALAFARTRSDSIDRTIAAFPARIGAALTPADALSLDAQGKLIAFKSMENSYPFGEDLALMEEFYGRGVRLASPVHGANNQFADSATDEPRWNGLSPLGRQWVAEMNRLGMVIDASHASDAAFDQMLALYKTPLLLSHSTAKWAFDHPRNLDDARIRRLAETGGAICVSTIFLSNLNASGARGPLFERFDSIAEMSPAEQEAFSRQWYALNQTSPVWDTDFDRYMEMVLHTIEVAGVDHVCFSGDWDGGGGFAGLEDISALPRVTERLRAAGYSDEDLAKMLGGNILRVMAAAQAAAE